MFATVPQTLLFGIAKDGVQGWKIQVSKDVRHGRPDRASSTEPRTGGVPVSRTVAYGGFLHIVAEL